MDIRKEIREEGRIAGWRQGRKEERQMRDKQIVLNMLKKSADIAFISEVTGLSKAEIKKFKNGSQ